VFTPQKNHLLCVEKCDVMVFHRGGLPQPRAYPDARSRSGQHEAQQLRAFLAALHREEGLMVRQLEGLVCISSMCALQACVARCLHHALLTLQKSGKLFHTDCGACTVPLIVQCPWAALRRYLLLARNPAVSTPQYFPSSCVLWGWHMRRMSMDGRASSKHHCGMDSPN
jgi:hypothetical protein